MSTNEPIPNESDIGTRNLERLLKQAYSPEMPDANFVWSVKEVLCATARDLTQSRAQVVWSPITGDAGSQALTILRGPEGNLSPRETRLRRQRRRLGWAMTAAAAVAAVALFLHAWRYRPLGDPENDPLANSLADLSGVELLTPKPRPPVPAIPSLGIGEALSTPDGQRRRAKLPDGSIVFLNLNTTIKLEGDRRLVLSAGEIFIEVAPREPDINGATFTVQAHGRAVTALGTKFAVRVEAAGTGVIVTQGKVRVSGFDGLVYAGQQLLPGSDSATPLPRASHALDWTRELMAASESPLVPASSHSGGDLIAVDPYGQEAKLSLRKFHVDVHVEDGFARTTIDQTYFNHHPWRLEGTFYFPLPPDASLSRLAMYVDGKLMEGGMAERDFARNVYETIVTRQQDPALLEWVDGSTFKMRVFPLEGRQEKRIILSYTQRLASGYGRAAYRFPGGHNLNEVQRWSFHARVKNGAQLAWNCGSHALKATTQGADLLLDTAAEKVRLGRDVDLSLVDPRGSGEDVARFSSAEHEGARYLMLRYRPQLPTLARTPANGDRRRDWVFLFESSSNRDPLLARAQIEVIRTLLANVEHDDTFAILSAGTRVQTIARPQAATAENVEAALNALEKVHLIGALDLGRALAAAEPLLKAGKNPYLVHVGSGVSTLGERREDVLAKRIPDGVRYVGVGVGKRWSRSFMKLAAERSGGYFTQINPDEPIAWRSFELLATLNTPRLLNVSVTDDWERLNFLTCASSVAQGEELCAMVRLDPDAKELPAFVTVRGLLDGQPYERTLPVRDVAERADYLPRTWARLEIERLLAEDPKKNKPQIVTLSKAMYVMTPFTSLLVLENDEMYKQFKVDRGRKDHWAMYDCPKQIPVVYEPDPARGIDKRNAPKGGSPQKPTARQVLQKVLVRVPPRLLSGPPRPQLPASKVVTALHYTGAYAAPLSNRRWVYDPIEGQIIEGVPIDVSTIRDDMTRAPVADTSSTSDSTGVGRFSSLRGADMIRNSFTLTLSSEDVGLTQPIGLFLEPRFTAAHKANKLLIPDPEDDVGGDFKGLSDLPMLGRLPAARALVIRRDSSDSMQIDGSLRAANQTTEEAHQRWQTLMKLRSMRGPLANSDEEVRGARLVYERYRDEAAALQATLFLYSQAVGEAPTAFSLGLAVHSDHAPTERGLDQLAIQMTPARLSELLYGRPSLSPDDRLFTDLVGFAPGMNTSQADLQAVLDTEASDIQGAPGRIDPDARILIDRARAAGWQTLAISADTQQSAFTVVFDGAGRYRYERTLAEGLREVVVCNGKTLLHLYPELGIGARRTLSRFHRADFARLVPQSLSSAEELAHGFDLRCLDKQSVALNPCSAEAVKEKDGKPAPYSCIHLIFATDGRLAERRVVRMPQVRTLSREVYDPAGSTRWFDAKGREVKLRPATLAPAAAPELTPDTKGLVVLPLPYRTPAHVMETLKIEGKEYPDLTEDAALALFAAQFAVRDGVETLDIFGRRFHERGIRSLGFYTLLAACGHNVGGGNKYLLDLLAEYPRHPLAHYLTHHTNPDRRHDLAADNLGPAGSFFQNLNTCFVICQRGHHADGDVGKEQLHQTLDYVRRLHPASPLGWALLIGAQDQVRHDPETCLALAEAWRRFEKVPGLTYVARYEHARCLWEAGRKAEARGRFHDLYTDTLKQGTLPPLDETFRKALQGEGEDNLWDKLMWQTADSLIESQRRPAVVALAWQCAKVGDQHLGDNLVVSTLERRREDKRLLPTLLAMEYLWQTNRLELVDEQLQQLLAHPVAGQQASLWRMAAMIAAQRGAKARSITCLERALDLEYQNPPRVINLQSVRNDYSALLSDYQIEGMTLARRRLQPTREFVAKVVRTADRWRALDSDNPVACEFAARILQQAGALDLAWEYLTTPLAQRPNEAAPWLTLAQTLSKEGDFLLADRAYAAAFEAEATNAQILWDQAQNLRQAGKRAEARKLFQQIADGQWQPRFTGLQTQARWQLEQR